MEFGFREVKYVENSPVSDSELVLCSSLQTFMLPMREAGIQFFHFRNDSLLNLRVQLLELLLERPGRNDHREVGFALLFSSSQSAISPRLICSLASSISDATSSLMVRSTSGSRCSCHQRASAARSEGDNRSMAASISVRVDMVKFYCRSAGSSRRRLTTTRLPRSRS